ncbi:MAG: hypothetical protein D6686_10875 [Alphaproteobacteria bacterium]|nr:MAG: hypothetical protein D6686_10875 [Alphaproteobacteria bacterium]
MPDPTRRSLVSGLAATALAAAGLAALPRRARAKDPAKRREIEAKANAALEMLYAQNPAARRLARNAHGMLIFPEITKGGFLIGMAGGYGVLRRRGKTVGYYETGGVSFGLQAGIQSYGYVLMFMSRTAYDRFLASDGFRLGVDASVAIVQGAGGNVDSDSTRSDIVAFVFDNRGLMLDLSIKGSQYRKANI